MSVAAILNMAKNALFAQQTAIQVTSNNIANVNTKGYARQEAVITEEAYVMSDRGLFIGGGVSVPTVMSHYDKFLEASVARENTSLEEQKTYEQYFSRIESILDENNTHLTSNLVTFFNGWQDLSTDPLSTTSRMNVATEGANLANGIRNVYGALKDIQIELNSNIAQKVTETNDLLHSIADLNGQIYASGASEAQNPALVSQRSQLVNQLSGILDVQSFQDEDGGLTIMTSGGKALVSKTNAFELKAETSSATGFYAITWSAGSPASTDITDTFQSGTLKSLIDLRDNQIGGFIDGIDGLAQSVMAGVNDIHRTGYNGSGATNIDFFKNSTGDVAASFDISDEIKADPNNVVTTSSAENPSNNDVALAIASLGNAPATINGQKTSYVDYGSTVGSRIGSLLQNAKDLSSYHQTVMASIQGHRDSVSGVSIDEEMTNLIKFQYAYQAAARLLNVADTLMSSLMEIVR
jgi:flagellar hook-associated protein 1 FlgK